MIKMCVGGGGGGNCVGINYLVHSMASEVLYQVIIEFSVLKAV